MFGTEKLKYRFYLRDFGVNFVANILKIDLLIRILEYLVNDEKASLNKSSKLH
jgi:hypothetical protein